MGFTVLHHFSLSIPLPSRSRMGGIFCGIIPLHKSEWSWHRKRSPGKGLFNRLVLAGESLFSLQEEAQKCLHYLNSSTTLKMERQYYFKPILGDLGYIPFLSHGNTCRYYITVLFRSLPVTYFQNEFRVIDISCK